MFETFKLFNIETQNLIFEKLTFSAKYTKENDIFLKKVNVFFAREDFDKNFWAYLRNANLFAFHPLILKFKCNRMSFYMSRLTLLLTCSKSGETKKIRMHIRSLSCVKLLQVGGSTSSSRNSLSETRANIQWPV